MKARHAAFTGSIPENYERHFVPIIFADYAKMLAESASSDATEILELACGTGIVTRHLAPRAPESRYVATDFNPPMLEIAKSVVNDNNVEFTHADAAALPFEKDQFGAVVCQFGVMFFPDRIKAYREVARVLKPRGRYYFNVWDGLENNHFAQTIHKTIGALYPDNPPMFMQIPFGYFDLRLIVNELQRAGFTDIYISARPLMATAATARDIAIGFGMGGPLANEVAARETLSLRDVIDAREDGVTKTHGPGPCAVPMQAFQISALLPG